MAQQNFNVGTPNGDNGDFVRDAFNKIEDNFTELYNYNTNVVDVYAQWTSNLNFVVTAQSFPVAGEWYSIGGEFGLTLDAADPTFDRFDLFVADIDGSIKKITGTPAASPAEPNYDFQTQYPIKFIRVQAAATDPGGYSGEAVFNEDLGEPGEWIYTPAPTNVVTSVSTHSGTKSVEATNCVNDKVKFSKSTAVPTSNINTLTFWILQKEAWDIKAVIYVDLYNTLGIAEVPPERITIRNGQYGYNPLNTSWQKITLDFDTVVTSGFSGLTSIPTQGVNLSSIDKIQILPYRGGFANNGYFIDEVDLQFHEVIIAPPSPTTSELINNGTDGTDTYVELGELGAVAVSNDYVDLLNKPTLSSDFTNDGADNTSTYVEHDELGAAATSNDYTDLDNTPLPYYKGLYVSLAALNIAHPTANAGDYANVDPGVASDVTRYIWDADDNIWVQATGALVVNTSDLANDGADGTSTFVENDEIAAVANSGSYTDLINVPLAVQTVELAEVTILPAALLDLLATPVLCVAKGGPNTVIKILAISGYITYNSVAYDFIENLEFKYSTSGVIINIGTFADWNAVATGAFDIDKTGASGGPLGIDENVTVSVPTTDATVGDSTIKLSILYTIQDFTF
jgi:hypothetical protein